jgi:hypothetical protein
MKYSLIRHNFCQRCGLTIAFIIDPYSTQQANIRAPCVTQSIGDRPKEHLQLLPMDWQFANADAWLVSPLESPIQQYPNSRRHYSEY